MAVRPNGRHSQCVLSVWMAASRWGSTVQCYLCFLRRSAPLWRSKPPSYTLPFLPYLSVWVLHYISTSLWSSPGYTRVSSCAWGGSTQVFHPYLSVGVLRYTSLWSSPGYTRVSSCAWGSSTQVFPPFFSVLALRLTGVIRIPLALELKGEMQGEGQVVGPTRGTHQSPAQARLLVPARGTENCKQSSCCCAVVR
jgi:hypothetical protein